MDPAIRRLKVHLAMIERDVAPVVDRYRAHMQCRPGCSSCCQQTFRVSGLEGAFLQAGLEAAAPDVRDDIVERARSHAEGQPCPALSNDGRCRLYEHRPRICRKYGIPLWHPDRPHEVRTCELNFRELPDIDPDLILEPQAEWARDWIRLRQAWGDRMGESASIAEHLRAPPQTSLESEASETLIVEDRRR